MKFVFLGKAALSLDRLLKNEKLPRNLMIGAAACRKDSVRGRV